MARFSLSTWYDKDFSGFLLDPLQIFKSKGSGNDPYIAEKSIIRPTFSYIGKFTISDTVFRQIIRVLLKRDKEYLKKVALQVSHQLVLYTL